MQFTAIAAAAFALAAGASAQASYNSTPSYPIAGNGTLPGAAAPSGTGSGTSPSSSPSSSFIPDTNTGGASTLSTGAMGLIVIGGIALAL